MPLYNWRCNKTGFQIEVIREFADYQIPPSPEELPEAEKTCEHDWERIIYGSQMVIKWPNSTGPIKGRN